MSKSRELASRKKTFDGDLYLALTAAERGVCPEALLFITSAAKVLGKIEVTDPSSSGVADLRRRFLRARNAVARSCLRR